MKQQRVVIKESACFRILAVHFLHHTEYWVQRRVAILFFFTLYWERVTQEPFHILWSANDHFEWCLRVLEAERQPSEDLQPLAEKTGVEA